MGRSDNQSWREQPGCHMSDTLAEFKKKVVLGGPTDPYVEEAWRVEIKRRVDQIVRGEVQLIPGDEVFERARRRHVTTHRSVTHA